MSCYRHIRGGQMGRYLPLQVTRQLIVRGVVARWSFGTLHPTNSRLQHSVIIPPIQLTSVHILIARFSLVRRRKPAGDLV